MQLLHEGAHRAVGRLVEPSGSAGQLHRAEIDLGRHESPQRAVGRRTSAGVREAENATANGGTLTLEWNPAVEGHSVPITMIGRPCHSKRCPTGRLSAITPGCCGCRCAVQIPCEQASANTTPVT